MDDIKIAELFYEVDNALFSVENNCGPMPSWENASDGVKYDAVSMVVAALDTTLTPEEEHERWFKEMVKLGFKYGKDVDDTKKTHPMLIPYEKIPKNIRQTNALLAAIVKQLRLS